MKKVLLLMVIACTMLPITHAQNVSILRFPASVTKGIPEDVAITTEEILYWIGEGNHEVVFVVDWCSTAFAWGYRFSEDSTSVSDMMEAIVAVDSRLSYTTNSWGIDDIFYEDNILQLAKEGDYWLYNVNGTAAQLGYSDQYVFDGDIVKWGDVSCAHQDEDYNTSWTTPIVPVSILGSGINSTSKPATAWQLYPNPAQTETTLILEGLSGTVTIQIVDMTGRVMCIEQTETTGLLNKTISTGQFAAGIYVVHIQNGELHQAKKLIIN